MKSHMKCIILAAGKGSRLGFQRVPKPMTPLVNGQTILSWQIEKLSPFLSIHDIILVVGYRKEMIMEAFPDAQFVYNQTYDQENTAWSLLKALKKIDGDVLWLNGDVVFHPSVIEGLLPAKHPIMVVNKGSTGEEEVKYSLSKTGTIAHVSKQISQPIGEALGINFFPQDAALQLRKALEACSSQDYFEKGIELCIEEGLKVQPFLIEKEHCVEIDFPEDLNMANELIRQWVN
jgi:choline kinase